VHDARLGWVYDLSALVAARGTSLVHGNDRYLINVCAPVSSDACPASTGACLESSSRALGAFTANAPLSMDGNDVLVKYTGGGVCPDGRGTSAATIRFVCNTKARPGTSASTPGFVKYDSPTCT
jgi:hypothetical protein